MVDSEDSSIKNRFSYIVESSRLEHEEAIINRFNELYDLSKVLDNVKESFIDQLKLVHNEQWKPDREDVYQYVSFTAKTQGFLVNHNGFISENYPSYKRLIEIVWNNKGVLNKKLKI